MENELGIDHIQHEPVEEIIKGWKRSMDLRSGEGSPFFMFYIAGPEDKTEKAIDCLAKELGIKKDDVVEFEANSQQSNIIPNLLESADKIKSLKGNRVLVLVKGFEKVILYDDTYIPSKPHDWDQAMREGFVRHESDEWVKLYRAMNKQIIVVSTIGFSHGQAAYDKAVRGAVSSHFKNGIVELK